MAKLKPLTIRLTVIDKLTAPIDRLAKRIDGARAPVRRLNAAFSRLSKATGLTKLGSGIATIARRAALATGAIAALGIAGFKRFVDLGDAILTASQRIGLSTDRLQELKFAADQNDVTFDSLKRNLGIFVKNLGAANKHQGTLFGSLKKTNPELVRQLIASDDVGESFDLIADAIAKATTAEGAGRLAIAAFGRSGLAMVPMLRQGTRGLRAMAEEAHRLGIIIEEGTLVRAEALGDEFSKLRAVGVGLAASIGAGLLPTVERITGRLTNWLNVADNQQWLRTSVADFATRLGDGLQSIATAVPKVIEQLGGLPEIINKIQAGVVVLTGAALALAAAWALTPMGQIALVGAGIAATGLMAAKRFKEIGGMAGIRGEFGAMGRDVGRSIAPGLFGGPTAALAGTPARLSGTVEVTVKDGRRSEVTRVRSDTPGVDFEASMAVGRIMSHIR